MLGFFKKKNQYIPANDNVKGDLRNDLDALYDSGNGPISMRQYYDIRDESCLKIGNLLSITNKLVEAQKAKKIPEDFDISGYSGYPDVYIEALLRISERIHDIPNQETQKQIWDNLNHHLNYDSIDGEKRVNAFIKLGEEGAGLGIPSSILDIYGEENTSPEYIEKLLEVAKRVSDMSEGEKTHIWNNILGIFQELYYGRNISSFHIEKMLDAHEEGESYVFPSPPQVSYSGTLADLPDLPNAEILPFKSE